MLAPSTAYPKGETWLEQRVQQASRAHRQLLGSARKAIALERLEAWPEAWGVSRDQLQRSEFRDRLRKTPNELRTSVEENYRYLAYPGRDGGRVIIRDLSKGGGGPSAGGSSSLLLESNILSQLANDGELIATDRASSREVLHELNRLFFAANPQVGADRLEANFARLRHWPILQTPRLLRPEQRLSQRLANPQTLWDALCGLIVNYREGSVVAARNYLSANDQRESDALRGLLKVWAKECRDDGLRREALLIDYEL